MKRKVFISIAIAIVIMAMFFPIHIEEGNLNNAIFQIGQGRYRVVIGNLVSAQEADYTCDGDADDVTFQTALNALPSIGGQLFILAGTYNWTASTTVTRAIDNVSIIGVGASVYFDGDGTTAIFEAGGDKWLFSNFRTDAGGLEMGATSDWMWLHVYNTTTYYPLRTDGININAHSSRHGVGGGDTVFPADPNADKFLMWDDDPGQLSWEDAGTGSGDMLKSTYDTDDDGDIDTAAGGTEWDSSAATGVAYITAGAWGTRSTGIANTYIVVVDGDPNSGEAAFFTASGLEGKTENEFKQSYNLEIGTDVQAYDAELAALAGLTSAADKVIYFTGSGTADTSDFTAFARSILDDADEATFKATVNLQIGTDIQAWDTDLDDIAALSDADGNFIVGNGSNWVVESGATVRASLGLIIGTDVASQADMAAAESDIADLQETVGYMTDELDVHNPFYPGVQLTIVTDDTKHRTRGSGLVILDDKWLVFFREATAHDISDGVVRMGHTRGGGELEDITTIYSEENVDVSPTGCWLMDDGRIGVMATRVVSGYADYPVFIYSDNDGDTWNSSILSGTVKGNLSRHWLRYPTSVGGDDDGGWLGMVHQSRLASPVKDAYAVYTTTNGASWSSTLILDEDDNVFDNYSIPDEPRFTRLGAEDKWIVIWRETDTGVSVHNADSFYSTDLMNWNGPYDTGQQEGPNGGGIFYNDGHVTWLAASRPYHYEDSDLRGIPVNGEIFQGIVTQTVNAAELWSDPDAWPGWSELFRSPHLHGDPKLVNAYGSWVGLVGVMEGPPGIGASSTKLYSQIAIMTSTSNGPRIPTVLPGATFGDRIYAWKFEAKQGTALKVDNAASSPFSADISGAPSATEVVYDGETNENCLKNINTGSDRWGRVVLHNTTEGNSRLIVDFDETTNTITTESATGDGWSDNDVITVQSQTCTETGYMDVDLSDEINSREVVAYITLDALDKSGGGQSGRRLIVHPYAAYNSGSRLFCNIYLASEKNTVTGFMPINDQKLCVKFDNFSDVGFSISVPLTLEAG